MVQLNIYRLNNAHLSQLHHLHQPFLPPGWAFKPCIHRLVSSGHGTSKPRCLLVFAFVRTYCNNPFGMRWSCFGLGSCSRHAHTSTYRHVLWKTSMDTTLGSRRAPTTMWQQREGCVRFAARDKHRCATTILVPTPRIQGVKQRTRLRVYYFGIPISFSVGRWQRKPRLGAPATVTRACERALLSNTCCAHACRNQQFYLLLLPEGFNSYA